MLDRLKQGDAKTPGQQQGQNMAMFATSLAASDMKKWPSQAVNYLGGAHSDSLSNGVSPQVFNAFKGSHQTNLVQQKNDISNFYKYANAPFAI